MSVEPRTQEVWIAGDWRPAGATGTFRAVSPLSGEPVGDRYPVSGRADVEAALAAGARAAVELCDLPAWKRTDFFERYAERVESRAEEIVAMAHTETALPVSPRLAEVELPRTTAQLRQAAAAARSGDWTLPAIDTRANIRSLYGPLGGPVAIFGPNNFPLAFNSISGGDFAAALAAGNPVIAKAHPSHPGTTRLLAEEAASALREVGLPSGTVQLIYHLSPEDGRYLVSHYLLAATAYTGSRPGGFELKAAADAAGKPIYLELGSVNPVFVLPGALRERLEKIAGEFVASGLLATGQFCTQPGIVVLAQSEAAERFVEEARARFAAAEPGPLLNASVRSGLIEAVAALRGAGAALLTGGSPAGSRGFFFENTLLRVGGRLFLENPRACQREAFGNASLIVVAEDTAQLEEIASSFEGNLTGSIYSHTKGEDDVLYTRIARRLRRRVGRLLNDKMPTGVAVTAAMNHGGPFPATGHPGFTAVGIPPALRRFAMLECYDNVREARLPPELRNRNPTGSLWRFIDGEWTQADVPGARPV